MLSEWDKFFIPKWDELTQLPADAQATASELSPLLTETYFLQREPFGFLEAFQLSLAFDDGLFLKSHEF